MTGRVSHALGVEGTSFSMEVSCSVCQSLV